MVHKRRDDCRGCGSSDLTRFLELGDQPLANAFLKPDADLSAEGFYPLDVYFCRDCALVQLLDVIDPEVLFRDYIYATGTSSTIAAHNVRYAETVVKDLGITSEQLVVEVASNDGSLLSCFKDHGVRTLGVEPARNIAAQAEARGIPTVTEFFSLETAKEVRATRGAARAVIGNNVLAHVDDTVDFLAGAAELLTEDGRVIVEFPYLGELMDHFEYDTVYHEHLCYFSVSALARVFERAGLSILRVDPMPVHGGSLRVWGGRRDVHASHADAIGAWFEREAKEGLVSFERFERFRDDVEGHRRDLLALLHDLRDRGHSLAGYGAPAKGNTLLNYCGIDTALLPYTVDKAALKQGYLTPGMHIPVEPAEVLAERRPDYTLILAWNFAPEIVQQQAAYRAKGGQFIVPIPQPRILS